MDVRLVLAGVLILGYVGYKGFERSGGKLPFSLSVGKRRSRALAARKPPAPEKLAFERVTLDATPANLQGFIRMTGTLERLGFRIVADFAITAWPDTCCRGFVHGEKPVHAVVVERRGLPAHVELFTLFDDLSGLVTSSSEEAEDPGKPVALRFQQIPGLTLDELFVLHLSTLENLFQDDLSPRPATRLAFFEHARALLVIEHELRKANRALRTDSLSRALDALPPLPLRDLLKRHGLEEPTNAEDAPDVPEAKPLPAKAGPATQDAPPAESEEAPRRRGIGSSLLSRRMAAREESEPETPAQPEADATPIREAAAPPPANEGLVLTVAEAPPPTEITPEEWSIEVIATPSTPPEPEVATLLPFEGAAEAPIAPLEAVAPLPFEVVAAATIDEAPRTERAPLLPFEIPPAESSPTLPFEIMAAAPVAVDDRPQETLPFEAVPAVEASTASRPTCPHCGAALFSSLSSRCSKCKQAVR